MLTSRSTRSSARRAAAINVLAQDKFVVKIEPHQLDGELECKETAPVQFIPVVVTVKVEPIDTGYEQFNSNYNLYYEVLNNLKAEPESTNIISLPKVNPVKVEPAENAHENLDRVPCTITKRTSNYTVKTKLENVVNSPLLVEGVLSVPEIKIEAKVKKRKHVKVMYEEDIDKTISTELSGGRRLRSQMPRLKVEATFAVKKEKWEPPNLEKALEVFDNIRAMRKWRNAPIDYLGCEVWMDQNETPKVTRFQYLVSLMLSSKTRDEVTFAAMTRLRAHGLTIDRVLDTDEETLAELVKPVTFGKTKARHLRRTARDLRERFRGDVPNTVAGLQSLPGVGPKMAHLCMNVAWGKVTGIGVGSFMHRVVNRLGWARTDQPEKTRLALEAWLPRPLWAELNVLLVGFGQQTCRARDALCDTCLNATGGLCPASPFQKSEPGGWFQ